MNSVQIIGNVTRDPEVRYTKTGKPVASFTVAVNRNWVSVQGERRESTDYIPVVAWGRLADMAGNRLKKGARVFVEGRFQTRSYETAQGEKRYMTEVVANLIAPNVELDDSAPTGRPESHAGFDQFGAAPSAHPEPKADFEQFGAAPVGDDDIPF